MIRKSVRIRLYVAFLTLSWFGGFSLLLWRQARSYRREFDRLEKEFKAFAADTASRSVSVEHDSSPAQTVAPENADVPTSQELPRFIVLGHGRCSRWGYLDIQYVCDGAVDRFYYSADTVSRIPDDIDRELFRHEFGLAPSRRVAARSVDDDLVF